MIFIVMKKSTILGMITIGFLLVGGVMLHFELKILAVVTFIACAITSGWTLLSYCDNE